MSDRIPRRVHIAPQGFEDERIYSPAIKRDADSLILVSHDEPDETAVKVDVNSTDIQNASGNATGVFVDGGTLSPDSPNNIDVQQQNTSGTIVGGETITLAVRAESGVSTGEISDTFLVWQERW